MTAFLKKQIGHFEDVIEKLEAEIEKLQERYDNMSETRQESDRGTALYEKINYLEDAKSNLESAKDALVDAFPEE